MVWIFTQCLLSGLQYKYLCIYNVVPHPPSLWWMLSKEDMTICVGYPTVPKYGNKFPYSSQRWCVQSDIPFWVSWSGRQQNLRVQPLVGEQNELGGGLFRQQKRDTHVLRAWMSCGVGRVPRASGGAVFRCSGLKDMNDWRLLDLLLGAEVTEEDKEREGTLKATFSLLHFSTWKTYCWSWKQEFSRRQTDNIIFIILLI